MTNYNTDFYRWTQTQAAALAAGHVGKLDLANLAEEIESLGKRDWRELSSRLTVLMMHLLKWRHQPELRETSTWSSTIFTQRLHLTKLLRQSPSLRRQVARMIEEDYPAARYLAATETRLPLATFPEVCPWARDEVLDESFLPEATP